MFVTFDPRVRVHLGVVALGGPPRLRDCLSALVAHESRHDFAVSCLVNRDAMRPAPLRVEVPEGVLVERPPANLGWGGGLHLLRTISDAELFVWVQDDMLPQPGWLDALVDAAARYWAGRIAVAVGWPQELHRFPDRKRFQADS